MSQGAIPCPRVSGATDYFGEKTPGKYASCSMLPLLQHWLVEGQAPSESAVAYVGFSAEGLCMYAWLEDSDIRTQARKDNQKLWELGDTLEFFVKPATEAYWEIHVAPNNLMMDIHIPSRDQLMNGTVSWEELIAAHSGVRKHVEAYPDRRCWAAELCVPWAAFDLTGPPPAGTLWQFAVCRYNYSQGVTEPELSSTAPFTALSFHRCWEFNALKW